MESVLILPTTTKYPPERQKWIVLLFKSFSLISETGYTHLYKSLYVYVGILCVREDMGVALGNTKLIEIRRNFEVRESEENICDMISIFLLRKASLSAESKSVMDMPEDPSTKNS